MLYSYAYPAADGFKHCIVEPVEVELNANLGEFLLRYEAVHTSLNPSQTLMQSLQSTYAAATDTGGWDRVRLECPTGRRGVPRQVLNF